MEEQLRHLMNCGFVIHEKDSKFLITKIMTEFDNRGELDIFDDPSDSEFDSFESAIQKANSVCRVNNPHMWAVQCMHQHRGRGVMIADLEPIISETYDDAFEQAKIIAQKFIEQSFSKGDIELWQVKIRPCGTLR